jgi:hypothetical protein
VLWRTFLYSLFALFIEYLEEFIPRVWADHEIVATNSAVFEEFAWQKFVAVRIWLTVGIFMYCTATEVASSLGKKRFHELLFEPRPLAVNVPSQVTEEPAEQKSEGPA